MEKLGMFNVIHTRSLTVLIFAAGTLVGSTALGQNALGDGRVLERDLRVGGGGLQSKGDFAAEVRFRNSIITGNAPGGKSFRGNVGYSDPADFRGRLGSDDLYGFRRDSLYSGTGGVGYRGTDALQYQFTNATGYGREGRLTVSRSGPGVATQATGLDSFNLSSQANTSSWAVATTKTGTLRSTAAYTANRGITPVTIGVRNTESGQDLLTASSLLGLKMIVPTRPGEFVPFSAASTESAKPDPSKPTERPNLATKPYKTAYEIAKARIGRYGEPLPDPDAPADSKASGAKRTTDRSDLQRIDPASGDKPDVPSRDSAADRLKLPGDSSREGTDPSTLSPWEQKMADLRDSLRYKSPRELRAAALEKAKRAGIITDDSPGVRQDRPDDKSERKTDKDVYRAIREIGREETRTYLIGEEGNRDFFAENMIAGEKLMSEERYFDAEERFARALTMKPGDVTAMAARINAQLGSGLFVSAAMNLRTLIRQHPEAAGLRFAGKLLPSAERRADLAKSLRSNLFGSDPIDWRVPKESATLLAYLGYQTGDAAMTKEGLAALKRELGDEPADKAWVELLEGVWVGEEKK